MSSRQEQFRTLFQPASFRQFREGYEGINPDRPLESVGVEYEDTEASFRRFVQDTPVNAAFCAEFLPQLGTFLQGPFPLPQHRVTRSAWDCRGKDGAYLACGLSPETMAGKRTLDVGCNAGYDTFLANGMGAAESVGVEPYPFYYHALFLNAVYDRADVSFRNVGWQDLPTGNLGTFDLVTCLGLIYHVKNPMALLDALATVMKRGARLVLETHVLSERSNDARFVEGAFWGDDSYWWIFGDECLMAMLRASGFADVSMTLKADCISRNPQDPLVTVEGHPAGARAWFIATKR